MDEASEIHVPSARRVAMIPRAQERELGYRALVAHLCRGVPLATAIADIEAELEVFDEDSQDSESTERERVLAAIRAVGRAWEKRGGQPSFSRALSNAGVKLSLVERVVLSVSTDSVADGEALGVLLAQAAAAMERSRP